MRNCPQFLYGLQTKPIFLRLDLFVLRNNKKKKTIFDRFLSAHPMVAIRIFHDLFERLAGRFSKDFVQALAHPNDFSDLNFNVRGLTPNAATWLMKQEAVLRRAERFYLIPAG